MRWGKRRQSWPESTSWDNRGANSRRQGAGSTGAIALRDGPPCFAVVPHFVVLPLLSLGMVVDFAARNGTLAVASGRWRSGSIASSGARLAFLDLWFTQLVSRRCRADGPMPLPAYMLNARVCGLEVVAAAEFSWCRTALPQWVVRSLEAPIDGLNN